MKKIGAYFLIILLSITVFLLGFDYKMGKQPNTYYQVYLDNEFIGTIQSKKELEDYINSQADNIRSNVKDYNLKLEAINTFKKYEKAIADVSIDASNKIDKLISEKETYNVNDTDIESLNLYKEQKLYELSDVDIKEMSEYVEANDIYTRVNDVYTPNGIEIQKVYTYNGDIVSVEKIYKDIILKKSCTISGYRFTIKVDNDGYDNIDIYVLDKKIFSDAIEDMISIFVDSSKYEAYVNNKQAEIVTTGSVIENVYVDQEITYKAVNIPVEEKIYISPKDLSKYLLYGDDYEERTVKINVGDSIESVALNNKISVQEFLISNPQYTSRDNLLVIGTDVKISKINPKLQIVSEVYEVFDKDSDFSVIERYDENLNQGSVIVSQDGEKGLERISQRIKVVNGEISYVEPIAKEIIKSPQPKIISIGVRYVPNVGSVVSWGWPTNSGYTITSYYGYRPAVFGEGNFHTGVDIAGTGYGSPVYASNNGEICEIGYQAQGLGYYIMINHNNGYYSVYGHMSRFYTGMTKGTVVERGQQIGYLGSSGWATGPHLHFEIRTCPKYSCHINPWPYLTK